MGKDAPQLKFYKTLIETVMNDWADSREPFNMAIVKVNQWIGMHDKGSKVGEQVCGSHRFNERSGHRHRISWLESREAC